MKHLVVPELPEPGGRIVLDGDPFHYLHRVRRVGVGDTLRCSDGRGGVEILRVAGIDESSMVLERPVETNRDRGEETVTATATAAADETTPGGRDTPGSADAAPTTTVTLVIALLKGKKFDTALRQATELGVDTIIPVVTRHCVSRPGPDELEKKRRRWEQIAVEAAQQSGRTVLPVIGEPCRLSELPRFVDAADPGVCAIAFHEGGRVWFPEGLPGGPSGVVSRWCALIGSEGGLAPEEIAFLGDRGWFVRRLRLPVLRAETAVIAVGALVQHLRSHYNARFPVPVSDSVQENADGANTGGSGHR